MILEKVLKYVFIGLITTLLFITFKSIEAKAYKNENFHNKKWCASMKNMPVNSLVKGIDYGVRNPWRGFVDCLLPDYAVEADWDYKYREGITQAMEYGILMNRYPALLLIRRNNDDTYINRAKVIIKIYSLPIKIFIMDRE